MGPSDVKVVLLGATGVGKSSLGLRFVEGAFDPKAATSTVGAHFLSKMVTLVDGDKLRLNIWDTSGQERYRSLVKGFYRNAEIAVLVLDIHKPQSFEEVVAAAFRRMTCIALISSAPHAVQLKYWASELQNNTQFMPVTVIACNKCDIPCERLNVKAVLEYANTIGVRIVMDTSAKEDTSARRAHTHAGVGSQRASWGWQQGLTSALLPPCRRGCAVHQGCRAARVTDGPAACLAEQEERHERGFAREPA